MILDLCPCCECDPCDCHPNGDPYYGSKYIHPLQRSERPQSNRESDPKIHVEVWNGVGPSHGRRHPFGVIGSTSSVWSANQQTKSQSRSPNPRGSIGRIASDQGDEKEQYTTIHHHSREYGWGLI